MDRERKIAEVELSRRTVDEAVADGLQELGLSSRDEAEVTVVKEGKAGFLGIGREMAIVVMRPKPPAKRRRRRGRRSANTGAKDAGQDGGGRSRGRDGESGNRNDRNRSDKARSGGSGERKRPSHQSGKQRDQRTGGGSQRGQRARSSDSRSGGPADGEQKKRKHENGRAAQRRGPTEERQMSTGDGSGAVDAGENHREVTIDEQAAVAKEFVVGLLESFGLEGEVDTIIDVEENILKIAVEGDQTEALVGRKGAIMNSVLEVTRTVVQRKTFGAPRMRIDINGYGERRREALTIYASRQAQHLVEEGGEIALEPMNAADRKVVHDAVAAIEGVRSFSEGEDPSRAVVISTTESD